MKGTYAATPRTHDDLVLLQRLDLSTHEKMDLNALCLRQAEAEGVDAAHLGRLLLVALPLFKGAALAGIEAVPVPYQTWFGWAGGPDHGGRDFVRLREAAGIFRVVRKGVAGELDERAVAYARTFTAQGGLFAGALR